MERKGLTCLLVLALAGPGIAWAAEEAAVLQLGAPVDREVHAGEIHSYRLAAEAGDYVRIEIVQEGVDVFTTVRTPSGASPGPFDSSIGSYSTDVISLVADASGDYRFDVASPSSSPAKRYRLILTALRPATAADLKRVEAERADLQAMRFIYRGGTEGLDYARHAVDLWHALGDPWAEARALSRLGGIQAISGVPKEALAACTRALEVQRSLEDLEGAADTLDQIGKVNRALGHGQEAFAAHEESIALWEKVEQPDGLTRAILDAGFTHESLGETGSALTFYERALALSRQIENRLMEATALSYLGQLHMRLGEPQQALEELRSALDLSSTLPHKRTETEIRNKLGALYQRLGRLQDAIDQFAAALANFAKPGDESRQCVPRAGLGSVLFQLGSPEATRDLLLKAVPLCFDSQAHALALVVLSRAEEQLGLSKDAAYHLDEALRLQRSVSDSQGEAETLRAQGILFLGMHQPAQARARLLESIALFDSSHQSRAIAARRALARAEADLGNVDGARRGFAEALEQAQALDDVGEQALILAEAGRLERDAGRLQEALQRLESARTLFESFRSEITGEHLRARHFATVRETYERYIDVLMQLDRSKADPDLVAKAFVAAERSRARGLLDVLIRAQIDTDGNPELSNEELELRQELSAKVQARFDLPPGPRADALRGEIQALSTRQQIIEGQLARESGYAELTQPPLTIPEVQGLLDDGTALLEYLLAEPRSYLWVVTRGSLKAYELPGKSQIEALARQAYEALSTSSERDVSGQRRVLALLSRQLLAPALDGLDGKRLAIVADGALQYLPFAALPVSGSPAAASFLNHEHEIVMLPSASVLKEIRRMEAARPRSPLSLAIFADPAYHGSEPTSPTPPQMFPATLRGPGLERLSWTRHEAEQIAAEAAGHEVLKALEYDATRELALSDRLSGFRFIHFATHGFLDSDHPDLSGLALSDIDKDGHPRNGYVLLQDLYSLHLRADLVVLSACDTGLGRDVRGEGFLSLTHGFLHAGASQVIASLWPVRDRAAAELMQRLYRAMLRDGMRPAAALRAAQLEMQSQRTWRDPYFWAAFVAQGDWLAGADTADRADTPPSR
jgi:CHAT domain-containing protein